MSVKQVEVNNTIEDVLPDPKKIITAGILIILLFFFGFGTWAATYTISGAVIATGMVKVDSEHQTVEHLEGGIVTKILVRNGDIVEKGQPLMVLRAENITSSESLVEGQLLAYLGRMDRLIAERDLANAITWSKELLDAESQPRVQKIMSTENKSFHSDMKNLRSYKSLVNAQISQLNNQIEGFNQQLASTEEIIDNLEEELRAKEELYKGRYIEKSHILDLQRRISDMEGRRGQFMSSRAMAEQKIAELKISVVNNLNEFNKRVTEEITDTNRRILDLREQIRPIQDANRRLTLKAPEAGKVINMQVHTVGSVVDPRQPIMDIVPLDNPLIINCQVPIDKITKVHLDQEANVQLSAFDRRTTPIVPGKVVYISADSVAQSTMMGQQFFYEVDVEVDKDVLEKEGLYLSPGMPATAFLTTKARTVLDYLINPLTSSIYKSMRD